MMDLQLCFPPQSFSFPTIVFSVYQGAFGLRGIVFVCRGVCLLIKNLYASTRSSIAPLVHNKVADDFMSSIKSGKRFSRLQAIFHWFNCLHATLFLVCFGCSNRRVTIVATVDTMLSYWSCCWYVRKFGISQLG